MSDAHWCWWLECFLLVGFVMLFRVNEMLQSAFRKTHLGPQQRMRGTVVYGRMDEAAFMEITIWIADKQFPFLYQQHKIVVNP